MRDPNEGLYTCLIMIGILTLGSFQGGLLLVGTLWLVTFLLFISWGCLRDYADRLYRTEAYPSFDESKRGDISYYADYVNGWATSKRVERMFMVCGIFKILSIASSCVTIIIFFLTYPR